MMRVFVTGGTGFVGKTLTRRLVELGHQVTVLTRGLLKDRRQPKGVSLVDGDPTGEGAWQDQVAGHDVFINLAGASIFRRWNREAKVLIRESRILTTKNLVDALAAHKDKDTILFSTSAVGYYGFHGDEILDEQGPSGDDYLASLCRDWEGEALRALEYGVRVVICRLGIVLGQSGGALSQMIPIFRKGLGSPLGSGTQWFSWIHEKDLVNIYLFLLDQKDMSGPINCTAPGPVRNMEFTKALATALGKPAFLPAVPGFVIKIMKGEFGSVLLKGQRVVPKKLLNAGFRFRFSGIHDALRDLVR